MKDMRNQKLITEPQPIGEWKIGDENYFISFALTHKPNFLRRFFAWLFFGLRWIDFPQPKKVKDIKPSKGMKRGVKIEVQR
jgi:hypothetical protein